MLSRLKFTCNRFFFISLHKSNLLQKSSFLWIFLSHWLLRVWWCLILFLITRIVILRRFPAVHRQQCAWARYLVAVVGLSLLLLLAVAELLIYFPVIQLCLAIESEENRSFFQRVLVENLRPRSPGHKVMSDLFALHGEMDAVKVKVKVSERGRINLFVSFSSPPLIRSRAVHHMFCDDNCLHNGFHGRFSGINVWIIGWNCPLLQMDWNIVCVENEIPNFEFGEFHFMENGFSQCFHNVVRFEITSNSIFHRFRLERSEKGRDSSVEISLVLWPICVSSRLIDGLIDWLFRWLVDWLVDCLIVWLIDWLFRWLVDWLVGWLVDFCEKVSKIFLWSFFTKTVECLDFLPLMKLVLGVFDCWI